MNTAAIAGPRTLADVIPESSDRVRSYLRTASLVGGFAALTAAFAQIQFNLSFTPVPVTGQTFAVLLAGAALGWQRGIASQAIYWIVGICHADPWYADDQTGTQRQGRLECCHGHDDGLLRRLHRCGRHRRLPRRAAAKIVKCPLPSRPCWLEPR